MGTVGKKKVPKSVYILTAILILLVLLPFVLPDPAKQKLLELEENVIEPHFATFLEDFEIVRINVDRYQDTEDTRTYEVFVNLEPEDTTTSDEILTQSPSTARYLVVIKDDKEVVSSTQQFH
ncbi:MULTISPECIES: hypothetical protein [Bacillaceae]|uniref:Uncharacterized protein n=1 Tax=Evansella alkalicola TaxID=745819 RepID=A0ABS6JNR3_9BACI|nr:MULTISPECIES: hypothetical protein [Bacillaceae]MBU9720185.1 hypothetical protein [Bacillus alkalicola]